MNRRHFLASLFPAAATAATLAYAPGVLARPRPTGVWVDIKCLNLLPEADRQRLLNGDWG